MLTFVNTHSLSPHFRYIDDHLNVKASQFFSLQSSCTFLMVPAAAPC